jgi:riboflavin synthase
MFTGIIEGLATIQTIQPRGQGRRLVIESDFVLDEAKIGDSIAVNGACLTAVRISGKRFEVDVSPETVQKTTFGSAKIGDRVNLERALRLSDRLDGHLVSGHIDGMGTIKSREITSNAIIIAIEAPAALVAYMIKKGSVAVDGISLTINDCRRDGFDVSIIPHSAKITTIGFKKVGDRVNIETDMIGKYVERFVASRFDGHQDPTTGRSSIDMQFLARTGFL